jgi:serine/threonine protein kinase
MMSEDVRKGVWRANDCGICLQGLICYVMEYIQGCDMGTQLMQTRRFPKKTAQLHGAEITLTIEHTHKRHIVHR